MSESLRPTADTVLVVDDEESVRRTFREWLAGSGLDVVVLTAADAESALAHANRQSIDLAVLDWNLGSGSDGLQLLEDLSLFHPDIVAILVTGFAHQATPLDALRIGVRDYLDKNQDLNRETFLTAVRRQLERIRPAKLQRAFNQGLKSFRDAVEKIVPLVEAASALNDPVALPQAIAGLFHFVIRATGAADGAMLVRHLGDAGEMCRAWSADGKPLAGELLPFSQSIAATVASMQEPRAMGRADLALAGALQPFERGRSSLLAAPLNVGPGLHVVMELFDKAKGDFTDEDRRLATAAADFGSEIIRHALAERQKHQMLLDAVGAALRATDQLTAAVAPDQPPPTEVMDRLRQGLDAAIAPAVDAESALELAEAIRVLALRHGPPAVRHCTGLIRSVREMLDSVTGTE